MGCLSTYAAPLVLLVVQSAGFPEDTVVTADCECVNPCEMWTFISLVYCKKGKF